MYNYNQIPTYYNNDSRFIGGFLGPFILGGVTGGLVAPLFYNNGCNRPNCYNNYYYGYPPYQQYYGYYR